ncbi:hypothetical protein HYALB_00005500 [Hymenoscyphus albidus]|uniref:Maintenance of telomere capping protein 6 n=1 Tax=Hymenoscyphus albidus TaxID=595503 RepID=A0A9N9M1Z6_9HELO|nr:hypothetical protein HYALB_00005500 [Hymenoscyphus albidus]
MSGLYDPDGGLEERGEEVTAALSQRDLGLRIPINFVTEPGVSVRAVCGYGGELGKCISNLLAVGFRRFEIDLFWSGGSGTWSFCPVPKDDRGEAKQTQIALGNSSMSSAFRKRLSRRQEGTPTTSIETATLTTISTPLPTSSDLPGNQIPSSESYNCTTDFTPGTFVNLLSDYFDKTGTTLSAHLLYIYLNIHASLNISLPLLPPPTPTRFPDSSNLLSGIFNTNLSNYIYAPHNLASERSNINGTWYTVAEKYRPSADYYNISLDQYALASTVDGWPSLSFLELARNKRLLLSLGNVDPQMTGYNLTSDADTIFPSMYLRSERNVTATAGGEVVGGCLFQNNPSPGFATSNVSWADASNIIGFTSPTTTGVDLDSLLSLTTNSVNCGLSPFLNTTLAQDETTSQSFLPYRNFTHATIWSWAEGEPKFHNTSTNSKNNTFHCAAMSSSSGRWSVSDCDAKNPVACRAARHPWKWTVSTTTRSYAEAERACNGDYAFAAPRTALENSYLYDSVKQKGFEQEQNVWVDFNELDVADCWVTGGARAECLYKVSLSDEEYLRRRIILVPTIGAIIVLILAALTIFVKARGNHKTKRTKKRNGEGVIYEGVPS